MRLTVAKYSVVSFSIIAFASAFSQEANLRFPPPVRPASNPVSSNKIVYATAPEDLPPIPENVTASVSNNSVMVSWTAVKGMKYTVFRTTGSDPAKVRLVENLEVGHYKDTPAAPGAYTYVIVATANGSSSESLPVYAAVNAAPASSTVKEASAGAGGAAAGSAAGAGAAGAGGATGTGVGAGADPATTKPKITPPPADGDSKVTLTTAPAQKGDTIAIFTVVRDATGNTPACDASATPLPLAANTSDQVLAGNQTTVVLKDTLSQNQNICAVITSSTMKGSPLVSDKATVTAAASPPGFDWGLVRAYFTFGSLLSEQDSQFSHQDLFLSFHVDRTFIQTGNLDDSAPHKYHPGLNTFFDTRLTALPVAVQPCTSSSTGTTTTASSSSPNCSNSATTSSSTAVDPTQVFLNSQKSARLQFGLYMPFLLNRWTVAEKKGSTTVQTPYAMYFAPLIKTGFDTSVNGLNQTQQQSSTPSSVMPVGNSASFYKFYDYGFRLGHYQLTGDKTKAPDILSYLDVTWGRFSNMASLLCPIPSFNGNGTCGTAANPLMLSWAHDYRVNLEGLLEVPGATGFSLGFSANLAATSAPHSLIGGTQYIHLRPNDDLRFLFAYRFDITKVFSKLVSAPASK